MTNSQHHSQSIRAFLRKHQLDSSYLDNATHWFNPVADHLASIVSQRDGETLIVGVTGSQGSGKSTLAAYLNAILTDQHGLRCVNCSLDDFYLRRSERADLAAHSHPLLITRGVPGTHDTELVIKVLTALSQPRGTVAIPQFDKATDDRSDTAQQVTLPIDVVIFEGWCLGAAAHAENSLYQPINQLERERDENGAWRRFVNAQLRDHYQPLFNLIEQLIMLRAPSFDCVFKWRLEQEQKLAQSLAQSTDENTSATRLMSAAEIDTFIQHYQRITERLIESPPPTVKHLFDLDEQRQIMRYSKAHPEPSPTPITIDT